MEREPRKPYHTRGSRGLNNNAGTGSPALSEPDLLLHWGNRKRLRCVKVQRKDDAAADNKAATTVRVDRRVVRADKDSGSAPLPRRTSPTQHRALRNSEAATAAAEMRGRQQSNGGLRGVASPERAAKGGNGAASASSEEKKNGGTGSSSGSEGTVWPTFAIALTNKEKEDDFLVFKGSKLPQRPKKRAKFIQRTINLVSPGAWLCDLTLERYEVREKKVSKKRPRGLKAMGNMHSDSD
ncbi:uncharacterized protein LOC103697778 [Phoenix dactylifera]|uniref:Uncharacterized protein LOC103697778 n=1 Tax=Phoenix dactylifera TaxID=42345 RepID=A0A8B9A6C7_PHODC|nr:uncharacterized protein LOC103697778 [Phoenix dactylifera]XP_038981238.1 uncharacterized protein LOC103697778 [Phoenix dactylifera]XP_038981239.1 uncharacterized protein LOC103697778 [Phoenix dactylifera]XP_038981240.1 uncharacterized protein LOC103697778 [Phoenix dactylifera]XP_038981241.1 uncharacterized protein LOC103697778 [Phoenix dactylifera]